MVDEYDNDSYGSLIIGKGEDLPELNDFWEAMLEALQPRHKSLKGGE